MIKTLTKQGYCVKNFAFHQNKGFRYSPKYRRVGTFEPAVTVEIEWPSKNDDDSGSEKDNDDESGSESDDESGAESDVEKMVIVEFSCIVKKLCVVLSFGKTFL